MLLVVQDLREILSGTKRATLRLLSDAGRCGVRVVGKRVQAQIREAGRARCSSNVILGAKTNPAAGCHA